MGVRGRPRREVVPPRPVKPGEEVLRKVYAQAGKTRSDAQRHAVSVLSSPVFQPEDRGFDSPAPPPLEQDT
ncbi:hypothetical protein EYF80_040647 [Liparis tanakae]|uniref:Uncharacterized protein n=1 Tax=Liparis tanakae TaxID=230148 RepID=A0A4Z2G6J3_9TELE|nr:hypothetical protein EYF80_040647 [Liparis tanakae]